MHDSSEGIRAVAYVKGDIWIANEDLEGIAIVDIPTGMITSIVMIPCPIGLHYDKSSNLVFVSSKVKHWQGAVYGVDPDRLRIVATFTTGRMSHPTGIVTHGDSLFVVEQALGEIYEFSIKKQEFMGKIAKNLPREIEQIIMSDC